MKDLDVDALGEDLARQGAEYKNFKILSKDTIQLNFKEFYLDFKIDGKTFYVMDINFYFQHRFNPKTDFIPLSKKILDALKIHIKNLGFKTLVAYNIVKTAIRFAKRNGFTIKVEGNMTHGYFTL